MASQPKYFPNYTVDDYLLWDGDWELIDGIAIAMSPPPVPRHQLIVMRLGALLMKELESAVGCHCHVVPDADWHVNLSTVLRPDISLICGELPEKFIDYPPSLIVEVLSPSTRDRDLGIKQQIYQREGVKYYLQVDIDAKAVKTLRLNNGEYQKWRSSEDVFRFLLHDDCEIKIGFEGVFDF